MEKKDVASLRRQFKVDNDTLTISEIFHVYIMRDTSEIYHHQSQPFEMLDREQQELFMNNFKKVLTGQLDEKLFELKFQRDVENSSQLILHKGLLSTETEDWKEQMLHMTQKMMDNHTYDKDIVITFIRAEYAIPAGRRSADSEEGGTDTMYSNPFILCSINQTEEPKREMQFDYIEKEFKYNVATDPVIDLEHPMSGFLFPSITDGAADVNRVLYAAGKANDPDYRFTEEVLNGETIVTAKEDKAVFEEVIKDVTGGQVSPSTLANVYGEIHRVVEENEEETAPTLDYKDVGQVLKQSGEDVDPEQVKTAFQRAVDNDTHELKASSVVPKYNSKSIKINTKIANISISPQDLEYVRQVNYNGKRCIMIEVEEDAEVDGLKMLPESFNP
ncbi:DUF4317 domain-containing protein [Salibacterium lacus]|uniref:DUF4317 domain-containing protein n=1 Tax=Salibacterium lacus TaxID=1898109 RepID=A0ABW5T5N6_9BACI